MIIRSAPGARQACVFTSREWMAGLSGQGLLLLRNADNQLSAPPSRTMLVVGIPGRSITRHRGGSIFRDQGRSAQQREMRRAYRMCWCGLPWDSMDGKCWVTLACSLTQQVGRAGARLRRATPWQARRSQGCGYARVARWPDLVYYI